MMGQTDGPTSPVYGLPGPANHKTDLIKFLEAMSDQTVIVCHGNNKLVKTQY